MEKLELIANSLVILSGVSVFSCMAYLTLGFSREEYIDRKSNPETRHRKLPYDVLVRDGGLVDKVTKIINPKLELFADYLESTYQRIKK